MKGNAGDAGIWAVTRGCDIRAGVLCILFFATLLTPAAADGPDHESGLAGIGEPKVLFVADGDWTAGYFTSLAFTQESKSLVGTLQRNPGSRTLFLLGQRVGEVRSFDVTAVDNEADGTPKSTSNLLMIARNINYEILTTPSGTCREPLLLARSDRPLKEIEIVALRVTRSGVEETLVGQFPIPRSEQITPQTDSSIRVIVTLEAEMLVSGTSFSESKDRGRTVTQWGDVKAWDLGVREPCFEDSWDGNRVLAVACSADGKLIAAAGGHFERTPFLQTRYDGRVVCWDEGFEKKRFDLLLPHHQVHALKFSPDGKYLVTGGLDGTVKWIDVEEATVVKSLEVVSHSGMSRGGIECLAFSSNGRLLAVGTGSWNRGNKWGETFLVDLRHDEVHKIPSSQENHVITCVAFSADGKYLATGGMEGVLKLWRIDGGK